MSKLLMTSLLYVTFFVICGCSYIRPKYDPYTFQESPAALKEENNVIYEYPDEQILEKQSNLLQTLMNSRNPEDEAYVKYFKTPLQNWPSQDWIKNYQYGKRTSNSCKF